MPESIEIKPLPLWKGILYSILLVLFLYKPVIVAVDLAKTYSSYSQGGNFLLIIGLVFLLLFGSSVCLFFYRLFVPRKKQKPLGVWLGGLIGTTFIFGVFMMISIPAFNAYKPRPLDSDVKSNLHNIYLACKAYWVDKGSNFPCSLEIAQKKKYGYIKSFDVSIEIEGDEDNFQGRAKHKFSNNTFAINSQGKIKIKGKN